MNNLDHLIQFAFEALYKARGIPCLPHEDVESIRISLALSPSAFFDLFARCVAHNYFAGKLSFEVSDCAMNSLNAYCLTQYEVTLPSYAQEVYDAFDQGEYMHSDDNAATDPESKYTRPRIQALVVRDQILGVSNEVL